MIKEISDIIHAFDKAHAEGKQTALATVVAVEGSAYRKEGARMLIADDGELTGAISGGCLEGDALRKALFVMHEKKAKLVVYDTSNEDDVEVGYQLGCNGVIQVLIEPINAHVLNHPISLLKEAVTTRQNAVLTTLFCLNSAMDQRGTCLLYKEDGSMIETIQEKTLCELIMPDVIDTLANDKSTTKSFVYEGVEYTAFINSVNPQITLVLAGAGNDALPLVKMAELLGWKVTVVDGRPDYANKKRFSSGCQVMVSKPEKLLSAIDIDKQTMFVLMTHNYNYDLALLRQLIIQEVRYIGILGSRGKVTRMLEELKNEGMGVEKERSKIYGPVGLDIGAETPEEIALSIIAEIQSVISPRSEKNKGQYNTLMHLRTFTETEKKS